MIAHSGIVKYMYPPPLSKNDLVKVSWLLVVAIDNWLQIMRCPAIKQH